MATFIIRINLDNTSMADIAKLNAGLKIQGIVPHKSNGTERVGEFTMNGDFFLGGVMNTVLGIVSSATGRKLPFTVMKDKLTNNTRQ